MTISRRTFLGATALVVTPGVLRKPEAHLSNPWPDGAVQAAPTLLQGRFDPWVEVISDHFGSNIQEVHRVPTGTFSQ